MVESVVDRNEGYEWNHRGDQGRKSNAGLQQGRGRGRKSITFFDLVSADRRTNGRTVKVYCRDAKPRLELDFVGGTLAGLIIIFRAVYFNSQCLRQIDTCNGDVSVKGNGTKIPYRSRAP